MHLEEFAFHIADKLIVSALCSKGPALRPGRIRRKMNAGFSS